tara:strand:+ start:687 stop:1271 length:585 start_codon:yes stop_codon:yes gene_type:complete
MNLNKGAMFGLDARIALAIFGALSVISGAALYSAIQDSKVTSLIASIKEQAKAFEQYYLDTVQFMPLNSTGFANAYDYQSLITNVGNVEGWNGPYVSNDYNSTTQKFLLPDGNVGLIAYFENDDWGEGSSGADVGCGSGELCGIFIEITTPGDSIANAVDLKMDGEAGVQTGNVRLHSSPSSIYYKTGITFVRP